MASGNGKWETVVPKKRGQVSKSDVKKAQQAFLDNTHKVKAEFKNPLEEGETIYEAAFKEKENKNPDEKYPSFHKVELKKSEDHPQFINSKKQQKHKKNQKAQKPSPLEGIENKISKISHEELSVVIKDVQERFPTHYLIWLKEVASWFLKQFPGPAEKDLMLTSKPKGFPLSSVEAEVKKEVTNLLEKCTDHSIAMVMCFCITLMMDELQKGRMTIGLRILLQLLIDYSPKLLLKKMDEILSGKESSQGSFLAIIWTFSQLTNDLTSGLKVWWKVMFPVIRVSSHSVHVVNYIEELIKKHEKIKPINSTIDAKKFNEILYLVFSSKSQLANSPSLKSRMDALYPAFKAMFVADKSDTVNKFKKLLHMLDTAESDMQGEILELLVLCLSKDSECFSAWLENIENTLKPSNLLWGYLFKNADDILQKFINGKKYKSRDVLREKAGLFLDELKLIKTKGHGNKVGFGECYEICNDFQQKEPPKQEGRFSIWKIVKYLMIAALAFVFIDVYTTKGFSGSRTEKFAVNLGIDKHIETSLIHLEGVACCVGRWSKENIPKYYAKISPYVDPAIEITWEYTVKVSKLIYEYSKPALDVIMKQIEKLFEMADKYLPGYAETVSENAIHLWSKLLPALRQFTDITIEFVTKYASIVANQISTVLNSTCTWIYQLHPTFFDQTWQHSNDIFKCAVEYTQKLWQFVIDKSPVVMEASVEYVSFVLTMIQHYLSEGQLWLQNVLRSSMGGGNSATTATK